MHEIKKRQKKNGKYSFTACIRIKGYKTITATFDTKTKANDFIKRTENDIERCLYFDNAESEKHTLSELIKRFKENELERKYKTEASQKQIKKMLDYFDKDIGHYYLKLITPSILTEIKEKLSVTSRGNYNENSSYKHVNHNKFKSPATVNFYLMILSSVLSYGVKCQWLTDNPMHKVEKAKVRTKKDRFLTTEETEKLLKACHEIKYYPNAIYLGVLIALTTGARLNEINTLKWENVDFKNKLFYFMNTKNGENRSVPIIEQTYQTLLEFQKVRNINNDYVFTKGQANKLIKLKYGFVKALTLSNIEHCRFHDLRHTVASYIAMNGGSLLDIAEVTGHKTMQMVKRYSHLTKNHTREILQNSSNILLEKAENL